MSSDVTNPGSGGNLFDTLKDSISSGVENLSSFGLNVEDTMNNFAQHAEKFAGNVGATDQLGVISGPMKLVEEKMKAYKERLGQVDRLINARSIKEARDAANGTDPKNGKPKRASGQRAGKQRRRSSGSSRRKVR